MSLKRAYVFINENKHYISIFGQLDVILVNEDIYPYAMALSKLEDNAAQWERYADNAKGCCLVFNSGALLPSFLGHSVLLHEVFYDYEISNHDFIGILEYYFNKGSFDGNPALSGFSNEKGLIDNIYASAGIRKHNSFSSENEIRIITDFYESFGLNHSRVEFESLGGRIRKLLKVNMEGLCADAGVTFEDLFDKIIIGPRSEQSVYELKAYITSLGYEDLAEKIFASQCPLR